MNIAEPFNAIIVHPSFYLAHFYCSEPEWDGSKCVQLCPICTQTNLIWTRLELWRPIP